jgi:hypothetical protein
MRYGRTIARITIGLLCAWAVWFVGGFLLTPNIDLEKHKPMGDQLWSKIEAFKHADGRFPLSEEELLASGIFSSPERRMFLDRNFGHRKFHYLIDHKLGPILTLDHMPGALNAITVWRDKTSTEQDSPSNESLPIRSETNQTPSAVGSPH